MTQHLRPLVPVLIAVLVSVDGCGRRPAVSLHDPNDSSNHRGTTRHDRFGHAPTAPSGVHRTTLNAVALTATSSSVIRTPRQETPKPVRTVSPLAMDLASAKNLVAVSRNAAKAVGIELADQPPSSDVEDAKKALADVLDTLSAANLAIAIAEVSRDPGDPRLIVDALQQPLRSLLDLSSRLNLNVKELDEAVKSLPVRPAQ